MFCSTYVLSADITIIIIIIIIIIITVINSYLQQQYRQVPHASLPGALKAVSFTNQCIGKAKFTPNMIDI